VYAGVMLITC